MPLVYGERYWLPDPTDAFLPVMYKAARDGEAIFVDVAGHEFKRKVAEAELFGHVIDAQLDGVNDVCSLQEVTQAALLHTVKTRFLNKFPKVYTNVSQILIAINPFTPLNIYTPSIMRQYMDANDPSTLDPHIFAIGHYAVKGVSLHSTKNQAVLISGESGAGKTESTKLVLQYVSEALSGVSEEGIQDRIIRSNPILESFGNAMTVRNNNSSRFGKWIELGIAKNANRAAIQTCGIVDYLLEATRVTSQGPLERSYHVFFQLISARAKFEGKLKIKDASAYRYIKDSQHKAPNIDDLSFFDEQVASYNTFGISSEKQLEIFSVVMGILTLGNIEFVPDGEHSKVGNQDSLEDASTLLGISAESVSQMILTRAIKTPGEVTYTGRTPVQAQQATDAVARLLYSRLFKLLIATLNEVLSGNTETPKQYFGVLDIAGFESFELNSIEQLFINLSNEHLQAHFNAHIFTRELDDYKTEGVEPAGGLTFKDNTDIIALIDSKTSILGTLDEENSVPKGSDTGFLAKVFKAFEKHERLVKPKIGGKEFGVQHFAGTVMYNVVGFLDKNIDNPPAECATVFEASNFKVMQEIAAELSMQIADAEKAGKKKRKTVSSNFRTSLGNLIKKINGAEPHFVRCIKPNAEKVPDMFTPPMVMNQLNFSGVFEAVRIRQSGFATRLAFTEFVGCYRALLPPDQQKNIGKDVRKAVDVVISALPGALSTIGKFDANDILVGKTKVFIRQQLVNLLDKCRDLMMVSYVVTIQRCLRGYSTRKLMKVALLLNKELNAWSRENMFYESPGYEHTLHFKLKTVSAMGQEIEKLTTMLEKAADLNVHLSQLTTCETRCRRMRLELETLQNAQKCISSIDPLELEQSISRLNEMDLNSLEEAKALRIRVEKLKVQLPLFEALTNALGNADHDEDVEGLTELLAELEKQSLVEDPSLWITEVKGNPLVLQLQSKIADIQRKQQKKEAELRKLEEEAREMETKKQAEEASKAKEAINKLKADQSIVEEKLKQAKLMRRKSTITGLSEDDTSKVLLELLAAMDTYNVPRLHKALGIAIRNKITEQTTIEEAQKLFSDLAREEFLVSKMQSTCRLIKDGLGDESTNLQGLQNLMNQAVSLNVADDAISAARKVMQERVRERTRNTIKGNVCNDVDVNTRSLVDEAFSDLSGYARLKNPATWKGHRPNWIFGNSEKGCDVMLRHNINPLREALTMIGEGFEDQALQAFSCILGWMYDKPSQEIARLGLKDEVLRMARSDQRLGDEIYVQLMKQLSGNPSPRSEVAGWKLMLALTQSVRPGHELLDFMHVFMVKQLASSPATKDGEERTSLIEECIANRNKAETLDKEPAQESLVLSVTLMDGSQRKVRANPSTTIEQLGEIVREQLGVNKEGDWALCLNTAGSEAMRLIPPDATVDITLQKWQHFQEKSGKSCWFVFQRRFLKANEVLDVTNPTHVLLTYRQALYDYLRYPVSVDLKWLCKNVAPKILHLERDRFKTELKAGSDADLTGPGILEQFLPERVLKYGAASRKHISDSIRAALRNYPAETRMVTMSRALREFQQLELFGTFTWTGKQVQDVEESKITVSDKKFAQSRRQWAAKHKIEGGLAPPKQFLISQESQNHEYVLALDFWGVRFLTVEPGNALTTRSRGFLFNEDTWERVLVWGAKGNLLQLIVTTVNPDNPSAGGPMKINFLTPAAVDICFTLHTMYAARGQSEHPQ